jgi:hypothetical protein
MDGREFYQAAVKHKQKMESFKVLALKLKYQVEQQKERHKATSFCESPRNCGGCHFLVGI